ncbi:thiamine diphosphokinase [Oricola indica]|jgi:thiamine pyrophosphokinase|uniref:thiamine diphosphokinase n=1 Tax=Oricola indica TaxID=2872591 RepID=UPI001CBDD6EC|nr:thiamine diphosphokinase [Oricola indica]
MTRRSSNRFAILLDGRLRPTARLRAQLEGCRVLAADGGIRHAESLGLTPEMWLGDFDSVDDDLSARHAGVPRDSHPAEKAVSDGNIAIRHALDQGAREIVVVGALGGERSDHAFFNLAIATALALQEPDLTIMLTSGDEEAIPLKPGQSLFPDWPHGTLFSVVGFTFMAGLTVKSAKWPLDSVNVPFGSTWTLSNVSGDDLEILLSEGSAAAIGRFDNSLVQM